MTQEPIQSNKPSGDADDIDTTDLRLLQVARLQDAYGKGSEAYKNTSFGRLTPEEIDAFQVTESYRKFSLELFQGTRETPCGLA